MDGCVIIYNFDYNIFSSTNKNIYFLSANVNAKEQKKRKTVYRN